MDEFHLLRPYWLLGLVPVIVIWWQIFRQRSSSGSLGKLVDPHLLPYLRVGEKRQGLVDPSNLILILWLLAVLALVGPSWKREPSPFAGEQAGLMVLLKVSETMNAGDVAPSRLERAKFKLRDLLAMREQAPTGLIVYSGSAHLVMPMTRDDEVLSTMIEDLTPSLMPADGDALGMALSKATDLIESSGRSGSILVMADASSLSESDLPEDGRVPYPVQFLAVQPEGTPVQSGIQNSARLLGARITRMTHDPSDIAEVSRRAVSESVTSLGIDGKERWKDAGYSILPLMVLLSLFWSRKGWVMK